MCRVGEKCHDSGPMGEEEAGDGKIDDMGEVTLN